MQLAQALLLDAFFAAVAAIGFAVISNPPRRAVVVAAILSAIGHSFRYFLIHEMEMDIVAATFIAAFLMGSLSFSFAKIIKCPNEVFTFPSLLPMIPGLYCYNMFLSLTKYVRSDMGVDHQMLIEEIFRNGLTAIFILMALVMGVSLPVMLYHKESFRVTRRR